jgi:hypothetical protein
MPFIKGIKININREHWAFCLVLLSGLILGMLYLFLVPPWQHYDEPGHFEFAWLVANRNIMPGPGEVDQQMRREMAASMMEHGFYRGMDFHPNLLLQEGEIWIGISQINDRLIYYALLGVFLRFVPTSDITFQLYLGRLISLMLFSLCIVSARGIAVELSSPGNPIRWMLPASIVLLPGLTDIMTAINDDVGATALYSLFLWAGVRLMGRGFNWGRFMALLITAGLCFYTKNTVTVAIFMIFIPLLLSILRGSKRRMAWTIIAVGAVAFAILAFAWGDAAFWYRFTPPDHPTRARNQQAPLGMNTFIFSLSPQTPLPRLIQIIPTPIEENLRGKPVTLGAWIWASKPGKVRTPILVTQTQTIAQEVEVDVQPSFFSFSTKIRPDNTKLNVILSPVKSAVKEGSSVYYDGIVLVEGKRPPNKQPDFDDPDGRRGRWGKASFVNVLRNSSAEDAWPWLRNWADRFISELFPGRASLILALLLDWPAAKSYYLSTFIRISQSFWARFGWGHVPLLLSRFSYPVLGFITLAGLVGGVRAFWRHRKQLPADYIFFFGVSLVFIWGSTIMRGSSSILDGPYLIPVARYAYPVIIPTMLVLDLGWLELFYWLKRILKIPSVVAYAIFLTLFLGLGALSLLTIVKFYGNVDVFF